MSKNKKQVRANFRNAVFKRAKYKCEVCGVKGKCRQTGDGHKDGVDLDAHHITPRDQCADGGYVVTNGISVCDECHILAEYYEQGPLPPAKLRKIINDSK